MMGASVGSLPVYTPIFKKFGAIENLMGIINDSTEKDELKGELKEEFLAKYHSMRYLFLMLKGRMFPF